MSERWRAWRNPSNLDVWGLKCSGNQGASTFRCYFYSSEVWCQCWKVLIMLIMLIITKPNAVKHLCPPRSIEGEPFKISKVTTSLTRWSFTQAENFSLDLLPGVFVPKNFQIGRNSCRWARNPEPPHSQIRKTQHDKRSRFSPVRRDIFPRMCFPEICMVYKKRVPQIVSGSMPIALWHNIMKHERTSQIASKRSPNCSDRVQQVSSLNLHKVSNSSKWGNEAYQDQEVEIWFGRRSSKISGSQRFPPSLCLKNTSNNISCLKVETKVRVVFVGKNHLRCQPAP